MLILCFFLCEYFGEFSLSFTESRQGENFSFIFFVLLNFTSFPYYIYGSELFEFMC